METSDVKKSETDDEESDGGHEDLPVNQEEADIREMRYRLETLGLEHFVNLPFPSDCNH